MREYFLRLTLMLAGIAALWACSRTMEGYNKANAAWNETLAIAGNGNATMATSASKTLSGEELMLELPFIPETISSPEDKAGFIAIHFWDNLDFSDHSRALNQKFMEQNFVDYLSVLPAVMSSDRVRAFESMFARAVATPETFKLIKALGDKYLNDPRSPMVNGEYYADFVKASQRQGR